MAPQTLRGLLRVAFNTRCCGQLGGFSGPKRFIGLCMWAVGPDSQLIAYLISGVAAPGARRHSDVFMLGDYLALCGG